MFIIFLQGPPGPAGMIGPAGPPGKDVSSLLIIIFVDSKMGKAKVHQIERWSTQIALDLRIFNLTVS